MKKIIIVLFFITVIYSIKTNSVSEILIPDTALRFRVIANSDTEEDQQIKTDIKNDVDIYLNDLLSDATSIDDARNLIETNIENINNIIEDYNVDYTTNYGDNYFPEKVYKGVTYPSGNYESLVITLGEGTGKNWWCVMYPPLCLLDNDEYEETEYKIFVKELIDNYLSS